MEGFYSHRRALRVERLEDRWLMAADLARQVDAGIGDVWQDIHSENTNTAAAAPGTGSSTSASLLPDSGSPSPATELESVQNLFVPAQHEEGDANRDGEVDLLDLVMVVTRMDQIQATNELAMDFGVAAFTGVNTGDFDQDTDVDFSDFMQWQRQAGQSGAGLSADGNRDGTVDGLDYDIWEQTFGESSDGIGPGAFDILSPLGQISSTTATVEWEAAAGAVAYDVVIATDLGLTNVIQSHDDIVGTSIEVTGLPESTDLHVGVTAYDAASDATLADNNGSLFRVVTELPTAHTIFATSFLTQISAFDFVPPQFPAWGSVEAADWIVNLAANQAGLFPGWDGISLEWKAIVSDPTENAIDRLGITGPIDNRNGDRVAESAADFFDGTLSAAVGYDEFGDPVTGLAWTGTLFDGTYSGFSAGANWTSQQDLATMGSVTATDGTWLDDQTQLGGSTARLYGISPPLN